jgi:hypothetical protein
MRPVLLSNFIVTQSEHNLFGFGQLFDLGFWFPATYQNPRSVSRDKNDCMDFSKELTYKIAMKAQ